MGVGVILLIAFALGVYFYRRYKKNEGEVSADIRQERPPTTSADYWRSKARPERQFQHRAGKKRRKGKGQ
jgi:hypothetical protein